MLRPVELGPNQPRMFYRGGEAIAEFRGLPVADGFRPEDWVGSATARFGSDRDGLSRLPDGGYLVEAIEADPEAWLGPEHARYFGASPALLVKLLDAGERLPVHVHPPRDFALRHLGSRHGKTEAWAVLGTRGAEPAVYLGWVRDVETEELSGWVNRQEVATMLAHLHVLHVGPGDTVLVPAGTPHAIGEGVFVLELQEPTDYSIMLQTEGFDMGGSAGDLGLGRDLAVSCVREKELTPGALEELRGRVPGYGQVDGRVAGPGRSVLPVSANPYFRAHHVAGPGGELAASFSVVAGLRGEGSVQGDGWEADVRAGTTMVVPWAAGAAKVHGELELLQCLPPRPEDAAKDAPAG
ncbi:MAG TPA: class I mannose-6-phosphate isomerase [Acidimicrobiales bacterium]|nr:class I mannose-6-phosphate isomerase [Acidimicrobiales bacterium]